MNYFSLKPAIIFLVAWVAIAGTWLVVGISTGASGTANVIAVTLLLVGAIFGWSLYSDYCRLKTVFQAVVPEEMYIHLRKTKQGDYNVWYARLCLESSPGDRVDIVFSVPETDWIPQISRDEKVKVYRENRKDEIVIETKYGLLWPTGPIGLGQTSI